LDGTRILALMPRNYNGSPNPAQLIDQWTNCKQKEKIDHFLFPFGFGDGGGGATAEMIEYGRRTKDLIGIPKTEFGTVGECIDRIMKECPPEQLPTWNGELYFELHRGCQTSHSRTKRFNRKCEFKLQEAEFFGVLAMLHGGEYEHALLEETWKTVLTNQFHDILPGTSVNEVYVTAEKEYAEALQAATDAGSRALQAVGRKLDTAGEGTPILVFNSLSWDRMDVVEVAVALPKGPFHVVDADGVPVLHQKLGDDRLLFEAPEVPSMGHAIYRIVPGSESLSQRPMLKASSKGMENEFLRIKFDKNGALASIYDKIEGREIVPKGRKANELQLFEDRPNVWEAWDIDFNFEENQWAPDVPETVQVIEQGPVRAIVRIVRRTNQSTITQDVTMYAHAPRVDFVTEVDWQERRTLLKAAFPVEVRSNYATFDVQYGTIERTTHTNREADLAQFEVAAHKWMDLSEGDYGVSVLNDSKYGCDVKGNVLRLSLLRGPMLPDPDADKGRHCFTYSVYPHALTWRNGTVQQAFELNKPLVAAVAASSNGALPAVGSFVAVDVENVVIDTVKKHEDSDAVIVRLFEHYGQRGKATLTFGRTPKSVVECDLMEENDTATDFSGDSVTLNIKPYEIRTLKVRF